MIVPTSRRFLLKAVSSLGLGGSLGPAALSAAAQPALTLPAGRLVAHRGFGTQGAPNALSPENTLSAFRRALSLGVRRLETDVLDTKDGVPILMHDATLDRTTNGHGPVADQSFVEIAALDAAARFPGGAPREPVPRFADFLALCRAQGATALPEIKAARRPEDVARLLAIAEEAGMAADTVWQSRRLGVLEEIARRRGPAARIALIRNDLTDFAQFRALPGSRTLILRATALTRGLVTPSDVLQAGVALIPWTVNRREVAAGLIEAGCDGILTDGPL